MIGTVVTHYRILEKLGAKTRTEAVALRRPAGT